MTKVDFSLPEEVETRVGERSEGRSPTPERWATGVAVANIGSASTTASVQAYTSSGTSLGSTSLLIAANGRAAFDVGTTVGAGSGRLKITANQPLGGLEVFTNQQSRAIAGLPAGQ